MSWLVWFLVLFGALKGTSTESCAIKLENVLKKPAACGAAYFGRLAKDLELQLGYLSPTAAFCARFRQQWQVGLEVLNAFGQYICSNANNPTAGLYLEIFTKLNFRSASDRFTFYLNYNSTEIPGTDSANMDIFGIRAFGSYFGIQAYNLAPNFADFRNHLSQAKEYLNALPALKIASNQEDVLSFIEISDIVTHTDQDDFQTISYAIQKFLGELTHT